MNAADKIEIVKITPVATGGALQAFVSVRIGALTIHDFRVVKQEGQRAWVSEPQKEVTRDGGNRRFFRIVEVAEPLKRIVFDKVLAAWHGQTGDINEPLQPVRSSTRPY